MREKVYPIPFVRSASKLPIVEQTNEEQFIVIDMRGIAFIEPFQLVYTSCLREQSYKFGYKGEFRNLSPAVNNYFEHIRFKEYWKEGFDRTKFTPNTISSAFCLWNITQSGIESYAFEADRFFERNHFTNKDLSPFSIILKETFNNIFDHSESEIDGYTFSQYFPRNDTLKLSVCDFGVGIANSINQSRKLRGDSLLTDDNAIAKAIEYEQSAKNEPHNRGFGLDTIRTIVKSMNGALRIRSNFGYYSYSNSIEHSYLLDHNFQGTLIDIELKTLQLDNRELEDELDFW